MATPVLLINKNDTSQKATKMYERADLNNLLDCSNGLCSIITQLPQDEGLNEETCYKIYVEVLG